MKVLIEVNELARFLKDSMRLQALECGGVDNWDWYGESISDYVKEEGCEDWDELEEKYASEEFILKNYERSK